MARVGLAWFGVTVDFTDPEIDTIIARMNAVSGGAGGLAATLLAMGLTGPGVVISGVAGGLFKIGSAGLAYCNSRKRGIILYVLWVGIPWCKSL